MAHECLPFSSNTFTNRSEASFTTFGDWCQSSSLKTHIDVVKPNNVIKVDIFIDLDKHIQRTQLNLLAALLGGNLIFQSTQTQKFLVESGETVWHTYMR